MEWVHMHCCGHASGRWSTRVPPTVQALRRPAQLLGPSVDHQVPQQQPPGA